MKCAILALVATLIVYPVKAGAQEFVYRPEGVEPLLVPNTEYRLSDVVDGNSDALLPPGGSWLGGEPKVFLFSGQTGAVGSRLPSDALQDTRCRTVCTDHLAERICFPVCGDTLDERVGAWELVR